jgi:2-polyprenyl-3-methyl-5-hydroxy-6-metoxy-1,4-benzoquinol methylase
MDAYTFNSKKYVDSWCDTTDPRFPVILPWIGTNRDVLDLGCLDGMIGELFIKQGNRVSGIDASRPAVEKARGRGLNAVCSDLNSVFPFADASFDVVFAGEVIEHVGDVDHVATEILRVLRPGGSLVVTTPNLASLGRRALLLCNRNPYIENSPADPTAVGHVRYFIRSTLEDFLKRHGFEIRRCTSDIVYFTSSRRLKSVRLARWFPSLGKSLIMEAKKPKR